MPEAVLLIESPAVAHRSTSSPHCAILHSPRKCRICLLLLTLIHHRGTIFLEPYLPLSRSATSGDRGVPPIVAYPLLTVDPTIFIATPSGFSSASLYLFYILECTMRPDKPRDPVAGPNAGPEAPFPIRLSGPVIKGYGRGSKDVCTRRHSSTVYLECLYSDYLRPCSSESPQPTSPQTTCPRNSPTSKPAYTMAW